MRVASGSDFNFKTFLRINTFPGSKQPMSHANHPTKPVQPQAGAGRLAGRRIIITGAASGIGRTTARLFVSEGAIVTLFDRNAGGLERTAQELSAACCPVDITVEPDVAKATEKAAAVMGGI